MSDLISRQAAIDAIRESASKFSGFMEMEMYTDDDAIKAVNAVPSAELLEECHSLKDHLEYIAELEAKRKDLEEELHKAHLAVEHNRKVAEEEISKNGLFYRDGMIAGLKYAIRWMSDGEVDHEQ